VIKPLKKKLSKRKVKKEERKVVKKEERKMEKKIKIIEK
jgi:hypothetical protein